MGLGRYFMKALCLPSNGILLTPTFVHPFAFHNGIMSKGIMFIEEILGMITGMWCMANGHQA